MPMKGNFESFFLGNQKNNPPVDILWKWRYPDEPVVRFEFSRDGGGGNITETLTGMAVVIQYLVGTLH